MNKKILAIAGLFLIAIPLWLFIAVPALTKLPRNFNYSANVYSVDNFYDEEKKDFIGEVNSKTKFFYEFVSEEKGIYLIKNVFDVRTPDDKPIFAVERLYGVNPKTGMHVTGYGDKDREGYLFAPRNLQKTQDYVYWHINYDSPAIMKFQSEEEIDGLKVFRYEVNYMVDQTTNLGFLPGVPLARGVNLDVHLQVWVEPKTGRMIKYQDNTIAYYYDQKTKQRLNPWNKFSNRIKEESITEQVKVAKGERIKLMMIEKMLPVLLGAVALILFGIAFLRKSE